MGNELFKNSKIEIRLSDYKIKMNEGNSCEKLSVQIEDKFSLSQKL